ncbi:MAG: P1 family peptidase [Anaerolineae bacterium]|jgi:L-aminopeptidase/D-esterase-like protein|nr:P1 family peptidase [Anaerolineae bacterium]
MLTNQTLTAISGIRVGHSTHLQGATGCTVILCPPNTVGGVDQRGGAPGTRETDLLRPLHLVQHVHAIVLSGGSAYGLATADGVMRWLEERKIGFPIGQNTVVPIVPTAILMDLVIGEPGIRPDASMGYAACEQADDNPVLQGTIGAGTGCRIGGFLGLERATKGGIGSAAIQLEGGVIVAALVAVNALGDVLDEQGQILAGVRTPDGTGYAGALTTLRSLISTPPPPVTNTVIGVVATNAQLTKEEVNWIAQMAQDGLARAIRPAHTSFDGDTIFGLATGEVASIGVNLIGAYAAEMFEQAIRQGVRSATSLAGVRKI